MKFLQGTSNDPVFSGIMDLTKHEFAVCRSFGMFRSFFIRVIPKAIFT